MVADVPVTEIMRENVVVTAPDESLQRAAQLLADQEISGLPVVEDGELIGIITESDIISQEITVDPPAYFSFLDAIIQIPGDDYEDELRRVLAINVRDLMTSPVYSVTEHATVRDVATLMYERHIAPVPVVSESGAVIGIVSRSDIVRLIARFDEEQANVDEGPTG